MYVVTQCVFVFVVFPQCPFLYSFFFNDTATTEIYTLSLHDALPISYYGLMMIEVPPADPAIAWWGMKTKVVNGKLIVDHLYEDSPAMRAGIVAGDELIALNGHQLGLQLDRKSTRLNSSHQIISYAVFCLKKKKTEKQ